MFSSVPFMGPFQLTDFSPCCGFYLPFSCIPGTSNGKSDDVKIPFLVLDIFVFCKYSRSLFWDAVQLLRGTQAAFSLGLVFLTPALRPCWYPYQCHIPVWLMGIDSCSPLRGHQAPLLLVLLGSSLPTLRESPSHPQHAPTGSQLDTAGRPSAGLRNSVCPPLKYSARGL